MCLSAMSSHLNNLEICKLISKESIFRGSCLQNLAIRTRKINLCKESPEKWNCRFNYVLSILFPIK